MIKFIFVACQAVVPLCKCNKQGLTVTAECTGIKWRVCHFQGNSLVSHMLLYSVQFLIFMVTHRCVCLLMYLFFSFTEIQLTNKIVRYLKCTSQCFCFFFNGHTTSVWKFSGKGLNLSCSCDLCHSCVNARSFNELRQAGDPAYASGATCAARVRFLTLCATAGTPMVFSYAYTL